MRLDPLQAAAKRLQDEAKEVGLDITSEAAAMMVKLEADGHLADLDTGKIIIDGASQQIAPTNKGRWVAGSN